MTGSASSRSFYNYFSSMQELFAALSYSITHSFMIVVRAEMAKMASAAEQCDAGQRYFLDRARNDAAWGWAMVHIGAMGPLFGAETSAAAEHTISDGIRAGEFVIADAGVGRDLMLGKAHAAILTHLRQGSAPDMPQVASRAVLAGLGVPKAVIDRVVKRDLPALWSASRPASVRCSLSGGTDRARRTRANVSRGDQRKAPEHA